MPLNETVTNFNWMVALGNFLIIALIVSIVISFFEPRVAKKLRENRLSVFILLFLGFILPVQDRIVGLSMFGIEAKLQEVKEDVKKLENRLRDAFEEHSSILTLYEESISDGGQEDSYRKLEEKVNSTIFSSIAKVKVDDVKAQIAIQMRSLKKLELEWSNPRLVNQELKTDMLLGFLIHSDPKYVTMRWAIRGRAAQLLAERKEWPVPDRLIESLKADNRLVVKALALESFARLMSDFGYAQKGIFDFQDAITWWENGNNKERVKSHYSVANNETLR
jgi:hypothetical protein